MLLAYCLDSSELSGMLGSINLSGLSAVLQGPFVSGWEVGVENWGLFGSFFQDGNVNDRA